MPLLLAGVSHRDPGSAATGPQRFVQPVAALAPLAAGTTALVFCSLDISPWILNLLEEAASRHKGVSRPVDKPVSSCLHPTFSAGNACSIVSPTPRASLRLSGLPGFA